MTVETYGWDTVFAVELGFFNDLIRAPGPVSRVTDFATGGSATPNATLDWTTGDWQVVEVYGAQITLAATIETGTLTTPKKSWNVAGSLISITVDLALARFSGDPRQETNKLGPAGQTDWATVSVEHASGNLSEKVNTKRAVEAYLATEEAFAWFVGLFDALTVMTEQGEAQKNPMKPRTVRFAGAEQADETKAVAVMATTRNESIAGLHLMVSPRLLGKGDTATYAMSAECFLAVMIRPALASMFETPPDTAETDFPLRDGGIIVNQKELTLWVEDNAHNKHPATIEPGKLRVHVDGTEMHFEITDLTFDINVVGIPFFSVKMQYSEVLEVELLDAAGSDKKILAFHTVGSPVVIHATEEELAAILTEVGVQLVLLIADILVVKFLPANLGSRGFSIVAQKLLTGLGVTLLSGLGIAVANTGEIVNEIEKGTFSNFPSFADVLDGPLLAVRWGSNGTFAPKSATLSGGLVCRLEHNITPQSLST